MLDVEIFEAIILFEWYVGDTCSIFTALLDEFYVSGGIECHTVVEIWVKRWAVGVARRRAFYDTRQFVNHATSNTSSQGWRPGLRELDAYE